MYGSPSLDKILNMDVSAILIRAADLDARCCLQDDEFEKLLKSDDFMNDRLEEIDGICLVFSYPLTHFMLFFDDVKMSGRTRRDKQRKQQTKRWRIFCPPNSWKNVQMAKAERYLPEKS